MKTLLIFPPFWNNQYPYLSLPALKAYLTAEGYRVTQMDVNASLHKFFLREDYLQKCLNVLKKRLSRSNFRKDLEHYRELEKQYLMGRFVVDEISQSLQVLNSSSDFFIPKKNFKAKKVVNLAYNLIAAANPCISSLTAFEMLYRDGANYSSKKALSLLDDPENNFLSDFYRDNTIPKILREKPDVIGLSIVSYSQLIPALTLAKQVKKNDSSIHITIGGNVLTRSADILPRKKEFFDVFDTGILYEGEQPLHALLQALKNGLELKDVPNLIFKHKGEVIKNQINPPLNVNSLPTPDFDELDPNDYMGPEFSLPIYATRGCYWNRCTFCDHSLIYGNNYRVRNPRKIADDIERLSAKYGVRYFHFHDECVPPAQCRAISNEIIRRDLKVYWNLHLRVEKQFNIELTSIMYRAGCRMASIGIESVCDRVLSLMDKGTNSIIVKNVVKNFSKAGILTHGFIILGFPGETLDEVQITYDFIKENEDILHFVGPSTFSLGAKSKVANDFDKYAISNIEGDIELDLKPDLKYMPTEGMNGKDIENIYEKCRTLLSSNRNKDLYRLVDRISVFFYASKMETKYLRKELSSSENGHRVQAATALNGKYRINDGIFFGKYLQSDGMAVYDFMKMKRIKTKDQLMCKVLQHTDNTTPHCSCFKIRKRRQIIQGTS